MLKFAKDDRGIAVVWVAVSIGIIIGAAVLAIDLSSIQTTRTQLQNAADAAVLAGVRDLKPSGSLSLAERQQNATQTAIGIAALNRAFIDKTVGPVDITGADVTFPEVNRITVRTHRTEATGDPLRTFFVRLIPPFGDGLADVQADATAEIVPASGTRGFFPWVLPDRFNDTDDDGEWDAEPEPFTDLNGNEEWDPGEPYDDVDKHGTYSEGDEYDPITTGYGTAPPSPFNDVGIELVLKQGNPAGTLTSGFFYPTRWPPTDYYTGESPLGGGSIYNDWIVNKSPYLVQIGDVLRLEFGNMQGPTKQGVNQIIDECPTSFFNEETGLVEGHSHDLSVDCPRIGAIAFFDPSNVQGSSDKFVTVVKLSHWFVESIQAQNTVYGRLIEIVDPDAVTGGGFGGGFVYKTRLVE
jgi:Flp pilus assembly protein TadG